MKGGAPAAAPPAHWKLVPAEVAALGPPHRHAILGIALAACLLRLFFWFYTDRTWEDALITVLHSENFARGLGLTHYHPGFGPVHGFTSPLSVLVPLAADIFHPGWGLPFLKLVSALLSIPTVLLAAAVALNPTFRMNVWLVYLLCGYLAFEHHQVLWGMAGMETQMAVFSLFLALYLAGKGRGRALGAALALCLYARPDFAFFVMIVGVYLLVADRAALRQAVPVAAALYAPWLVFTTLYYGSPVPNTIVAKGLGYPLWTRTTACFSRPFWTTVFARVYGYIFLPLGPCFGGHGMGLQTFLDEALISRLALLSIAAGSLAMLRDFRKLYLIPLGTMVVYAVYYIFCVHNIFGWYLVPFSAVNCLLLALGLNALCRAIVRPDRIGLVSRMACAGYLLPFLAVLPLTIPAERNIQRYIETPVRVAMGRYLAAHKKPGDRVGCEPLGYVAYYSRMPVYDYPGLASPEVTEYLKRFPQHRSLELMLEHFRPEWIALRENEYRFMLGYGDPMKFLETDYTVEKVFRADPNAGRILRVENNADRVFYLLRKRS